MNHILIPTDFSLNSWNATSYVLHFFEEQNVTFHFLHIDISKEAVDSKRPQNLSKDLKEVSLEYKKHEMKKWMLQLNTFPANSGHVFKNVVTKANFIEGIREYIGKNNITFMVMGAKGNTALKGMTIGSKTEAVITRVKCPILIIPEAACFSKGVNIGFPTDLNMLYKHKMIETLLEVARINQSTIEVLRVAQPKKPLTNLQKNNRELLRHQFAGIPHSFNVIENPNLEDALQLFVNSKQIGIVAMIAKNLNFIQHIFFKTQAAKIKYHVQIPFLILHD